MWCVADKGMMGHCYLMLWFTKSRTREENVERKRNLDTERLNNSFVCVYNLIQWYRPISLLCIVISQVTFFLYKELIKKKKKGKLSSSVVPERYRN